MSERGGFTLVEVLVAMAIFALLSAMTFQALDGTMRAQEQVESHTKEINEFMVVWSVLLQDFIQLARRPVRSKYGSIGRAFEQDDGNNCEVSFTRSNVSAGVRFSPSGMQRVSYCVEDGGLYRVASSVLDQVHESEESKGLLLKDVKDFSISVDPPLKSLTGSRLTPEYEALPFGKIEVTIRTSDGEFRRSFPGVGIQ